MLDMNKVNVTVDWSTVDTAAAARTLYRYNVVSGTCKAFDFVITGLPGLDSAAADNFRAAWYLFESAAAAARAADYETARQAINANSVDVTTADKAAADKAAAAVSARAAVVRAIYNKAAAAVGGKVNPTMQYFAAAVRGRVTVGDDIATSVHVCRAAVAAAIADKAAAVDVSKVRTACKQVFRQVWQFEAGVLNKRNFDCSDKLARHIVATAEKRFKLEKGKYVLPVSINASALLVELIRAMLWDMQGKAIPAADKAAADKAVRAADVDKAAADSKRKTADSKRKTADKVAADSKRKTADKAAADTADKAAAN